jgi:hypothetical protein
MATKKAKKPAPKPRAKTRTRTARRGGGKAIECEVCGYRLIVDEECGCAEEHVLICCGQPMARR